MQLFSGSDDGGDNATVRVWDISKTKKKNCVATLDNHRSAVTSIAVSEDGWTLLSAGRDKAGSIMLHFNFCFNLHLQALIIFTSRAYLFPSFIYLLIHFWMYKFVPSNGTSDYFFLFLKILIIKCFKYRSFFLEF